MSMKDFSEKQRQAFLDLAVLAMYADGNLAAVEDDRVQKLLAAMGDESEYDRDKHYDEAVSRVSRHSQTIESARNHAAALAKTFSTPEQRREVFKILDDLLVSDGCVSQEESNYLKVVQEALRL